LISPVIACALLRHYDLDAASSFGHALEASARWLLPGWRFQKVTRFAWRGLKCAVRLEPD